MKSHHSFNTSAIGRDLEISNNIFKFMFSRYYTWAKGFPAFGKPPEQFALVVWSLIYLFQAFQDHLASKGETEDSIRLYTQELISRISGSFTMKRLFSDDVYV